MNFVTGLLQTVKPQADGDLSDRLNYFVTVAILVGSSLFVSGWSFVGSPIQCWFPAYYKGWWQEYALDYCYVQNTYYVPLYDNKEFSTSQWDIGQHMKPLPVNATTKEKNQIGYYQWVPFILAAQALLFYLPMALYRMAYDKAGFKIATILDNCSMHGNMDEASRVRNMKTIAGFLTQEHTINYSAMRSSFRRITSGRSIIFLYLGVKAAFAVNAILQFISLKTILGTKDYFWGWEVTQNILNGEDWDQIENFPRVTMCDFTVRELGNMHHHTVQCVLMINMFNEKIFAFIWYWLCFMFAVSVTSFLSWTIRLLIPSQGVSLVNQYIRKIDPEVARSLHKKSLLKEFVEKKLRPDGVLLVRLIESNAGEMVTCSLLTILWEDFVKTRGERPPPYSEPLLLKNKKIDEDEL